MSKKVFYIVGIIAVLLLGFILFKSFRNNQIGPIFPTSVPTIFLSPTTTPQPTLQLSPRPTSPYEGGSCCPLDKKALGWVCITATCRGNPYPPPGVKVEECVAPDSYNRYNPCPLKCLSSSTTISTNTGSVNVKNLKLGMLVWTLTGNGVKELQPIVKLSTIDVGTNHRVSHLILSDGRIADVSPNHPTTDGRIVGQLQKGDKYDGSTVLSNQSIVYQDTKTYDLLPAGDTGYYFANGILMGSTLKQ